MALSPTSDTDCWRLIGISGWPWLLIVRFIRFASVRKHIAVLFDEISEFIISFASRDVILIDSKFVVFCRFN